MTIHTSSDYDFSVRRAVVEAWKKFALHWRTYLRYLWPFLLMAGIGAGLFAVALSMYLTQHAIPFFAVVKSGLGAQVGLALLLPSWGTLIALVVGLLLWLLGQSGWAVVLPCNTSAISVVVAGFASLSIKFCVAYGCKEVLVACCSSLYIMSSTRWCLGVQFG